MKRIYELATKFSHALRLFTILALAILGIVLTVLLFTEIFSLIPFRIAGNTDHVIFEILDRVIVFFLFFFKDWLHCLRIRPQACNPLF